VNPDVSSHPAPPHSGAAHAQLSGCSLQGFGMQSCSAIVGPPGALTTAERDVRAVYVIDQPAGEA
jgi:hypothetical protein